MTRLAKPALAAAAVLLLSGFAAGVKPVEIMPEADECASCRMSVQKDRFSSELLTRDGGVSKFDEIGCMVDYTKAKRLDSKQIKGIFVHDFTSGKWLPLSEATLVKSSYPTPMRAGILAFPSPAAAKGLDAKYQGRVTTWDALLKEK
jgi:copper chaperone NosL